MAKIPGVSVKDMITPGGNSDNTFPTHSDEYGKGGYRAVETIADRDAITYERRSVGMEVRVMSGEGAGVYYLASFAGDDFEGVTEQIWVKVGEGTGGGGSTPGGEKEVYAGEYDSVTGNFYQPSSTGGLPELVEGRAGVIYLDTTTGFTYHYNEETYAYEKINALVWQDAN